MTTPGFVKGYLNAPAHVIIDSVELNRRGFVAALAAPIVARLLPPAAPVQCGPISLLNFHREAFTFALDPIDFDVFNANYLRPAAEAMAREVADWYDRVTYANGKCLAPWQRRFDPARLPS